MAGLASVSFRIITSLSQSNSMKDREKESLSKDTACLHPHRTRAEAHEKTDIALL